MERSATTDEPVPVPQTDTPPRAPDHPLSDAPHLAGLTAAGAMIALVVHGLLMPTMGATGDHELWLRVGRWGDFGQNLAAIGGVFALLTGVQGFVQHNHHLRPEKRWLLFLFSLIFVGTITAATFGERNESSGDLVWMALGEANLLCVILSVSVLGLSPGRGTRGLSIAAACMALFGLTARVMERLPLTLGGAATRLQGALEAAGEVGYLMLLVLSALWVVPRGQPRRARRARMLGMGALGMAMGVFAVGIAGPLNDYRLVLYHAQRVRLLLDLAPALYAVPISMAIGAAISGVAGADLVRRQAALGLLLLVTAGYAPRAPVGLLTLTLAICLLSRAALAATWQPSTPPAATMAD